MSSARVGSTSCTGNGGIESLSGVIRKPPPCNIQTVGYCGTRARQTLTNGFGGKADHLSRLQRLKSLDGAQQKNLPRVQWQAMDGALELPLRGAGYQGLEGSR
jgi:hypothetical protein